MGLIAQENRVERETSLNAQVPNAVVSQLTSYLRVQWPHHVDDSLNHADIFVVVSPLISNARLL